MGSKSKIAIHIFCIKMSFYLDFNSHVYVRVAGDPPTPTKKSLCSSYFISPIKMIFYLNF